MNNFKRGYTSDGKPWYQSGKHVIFRESDNENGIEHAEDIRYFVFEQHDPNVSFEEFAEDTDWKYEGSWTDIGWKSAEDAVDYVDRNS